jgi:hypothetical protein
VNFYIALGGTWCAGQLEEDGVEARLRKAVATEADRRELQIEDDCAAEHVAMRWLVSHAPVPRQLCLDSSR